MRALLSPASLKGVLSAHDAAAALARGAREAGVEADELPVADGGEGTAEVLQRALGGEWREAVVADPLGRPVAARWLVLPDGRAVVEAAAAIGLPLLAQAERDPLRASSRGLGELVLAALEDAPSRARGRARRHRDGGRRRRAAGGRSRASGPRGVALRRADHARRRRPGVRAAEGRVAGRRRGARGAARRHGGAAAVRRASRSRAPPAGSAPRSRRSAPSSCPARRPCSTSSASTARGAVATSSSRGRGVDATTTDGKAPGRRPPPCAAAGVRCVVFGGRVRAEVPGAETVALSGDPARAEADLEDSDGAWRR